MASWVKEPKAGWLSTPVGDRTQLLRKRSLRVQIFPPQTKVLLTLWTSGLGCPGFVCRQEGSAKTWSNLEVHHMPV